MTVCPKWAAETSVSGMLAYVPMRPRARLGFSVVSALWCEQLLAGVLTLCHGQCSGLAVAEGELRLGEIGDSLGVSPALPCGAAPEPLFLQPSSAPPVKHVGKGSEQQGSSKGVRKPSPC